MSAPATNPYLRTKIMTASPEELRLMLYDGALRFCRQAKAAIGEQNYEQSYNCFLRAQKIVLELSSSLKPQVDPELCERLSGLYTYLYRRLVDANMSRDTVIVDEVIKLLDYERETWQMLMQKVGSQDNQPPQHAAAGNYPTPGAQQTAMSTLSHSA